MEYIEFSNGVKMPQLGYGVYQIPANDTERCVADAISVGYRSIDTAQSYFNEAEVGEAVAKCGVPRNELFLTTKVWIDNYGDGKTYASVEESMKKLKTDYIDMVLLHQPFGDHYGAWRDLEKLYDEGKVRVIGISNFSADLMADLAAFNRISPMVNQVECHPLDQQITSRKWFDKFGVHMEAWAPLGEGRGNLLENPVLTEIAKAHGKSVAQVILRWHIERGVIVIPKSTHIERMRENLDVFDFSLSTDEMLKIEELDTEKSAFFDHRDPATVQMFVNLIEQRRASQDVTKEKKQW